MTDFASAIGIVMQHEGGIATLEDGAGETRWGITQATCNRLKLPMRQTPTGMSNIPQNQNEARVIYLKYFWVPIFGDITLTNYTGKLFDDTINQGPETAARTVQQSLVKTGTVVAVDGIIGKATIAALNMTPEILLMPNWIRAQYATYDKWINNNPEKREQYRDGLAKRAAWPDTVGGSVARLLIAGKF